MALYYWKKVYDERGALITPTAYVSPSGDDRNGDGTANKPYRSRQKAADSGKASSTILDSTVDRELYAGSSRYNIFGQGSNETILDRFQLNSMLAVNLYDLTLINWQSSASRLGGNTRCILNNVNINQLNNSLNYQFNLIINSTYVLNGTYNNNTWYNTITSGLSPSGRSIFAFCQITLVYYPNTINFSYSCFSPDCTFKFGNDSAFRTLAYIEANNSTLKTGIDALRQWYADKSAGQCVYSTNIFKGCIVADPLFTNAALGDFTLQPTSPCRHLAYDGTFAGAYDVAFPLNVKANSDGVNSAFYNPSATGSLTIANDALTLQRDAYGVSLGGGTIQSKIQDLGVVYELRKPNIQFQEAFRNREGIDTTLDVDMSAPISAGTAIVVGNVYDVEGGTVTHNGTTYQPREKFIAATTSFTTSDTGYLYNVLETPSRSIIEMRFKQSLTAPVLSAGTNMTDNSWYLVNGTIVWNGKTLTTGDTLMAFTGQLAFTGTGTVQEAWNSTDEYSKFESNSIFRCRRVGNVVTGAIDTGTDGKLLTNGHAEYYNATNLSRLEFPFQARYVQYKLTFQNKLLK